MCLGMKNSRKTELLAPAGRWEALCAAVQNGADAVYIGEQSFSARKNAQNFTWEEVGEAVRYCHVRGVRVHLALNTLVSDKELKTYENAVVKAANAGVDALIIQDIGAAQIARSVCPEMELHASTQLTACNIYDVEALSNMGFSRVVLARELSMEEIRHIHENTDTELETFVHGALCISFSGKCLMSSFIGGRSGNRGMCAQPCRQKYNFGQKSGYFLSPRDLCLADNLKEMCDAGITSFKIEGRMKSAQYVAAVTGVYRKYLDSLSPLKKEDEEYLKKIFVRGDGFTKGYFSGYNTPEIMNYSISNDNLTLRADGAALKEAENSYRDGVENKKISVDAILTLRENEPSSLSLTDGVNTVTSCGAEGEIAQNLPLTKERAYSQIAKLGQTPFSLNSFEFIADEGLTLRASELNSIRREAANALMEKRAQITPKETFDFYYPQDKNYNSRKKPLISVQIRTKEQFDAAKKADRVLVPLSLWDEITPDERCYVLLPQVVLDEEKTEKQLSRIPKTYGVYANTPGMLSLAKKQGRKANADWGMNIYNSVTAASFEDVCDTITLSTELSLSQISEITSKTKLMCEVVCHGYQCVMTSRACLIRGITGKCDCTKEIRIKDKTGAQFTLIGDSDTHINTVLNSRPTFMADKLKELYKSNIGAMRIIFTAEGKNEAETVIKMYRGEIAPTKPALYTRGYLLK